MSVLKVKNGNQWDIVPAIKGDTGDPAADESITDDMLVTDGVKTEIEWLWGNQLMDSREGEILHAEDAYTAPAVDISVDGKSTQDGTPTPDAPVEIVSLEPEVTFAGKNLITNSDTSYSLTAARYATYNIPPELDPDAISALTFSLQATVPSSQKLMLYTSDGIRISTGEAQTYFDANNVFVVQQAANIKKILDVGDIRIYSTPYTSGSSVITEIDTCQVELGSTATDYEPYLGNTASLLPDGYSLRSFPDGTKDELHLSYLRPSTRDGWAWYSRELVKRVGEFLATSPNGWIKSNYASNGYYKSVGQITDGLGKPNAKNSIMSPWFKAPNSLSEYFQTVNSCWVDSAVNFNIDPDVFSGTALEFGAWVAEHNIEYYMPLATPTTETLDPIELPIMPSRTVNVWSDPATNLKMTYIQDSNLIIENLEATIADIATS